MGKSKLDKIFVTLRSEQVILDRDAATLYGVEKEGILNAVRCHPDKFPSDFIIKLTKDERRLVDAISSSYAFTEAGILMLSTILDSKEAQNITLEIIETFTEQQQLLRHFMVSEYNNETGKKKKEAYMESKLKQILARSSACI